MLPSQLRLFKVGPAPAVLMANETDAVSPPTSCDTSSEPAFPQREPDRCFHGALLLAALFPSRSALFLFFLFWQPTTNLFPMTKQRGCQDDESIEMHFLVEVQCINVINPRSLLPV